MGMKFIKDEQGIHKRLKGGLGKECKEKRRENGMNTPHKMVRTKPTIQKKMGLSSVYNCQNAALTG